MANNQDDLMRQAGFVPMGEATPPAETPVPATPAAAEPPAEPTPPAAPAAEPPKNNASSFDEGKWLNEKFGDQYKSVDEVLNKLKERDELSQKYSEAERRAQDFEKKSQETPFANDYVKGLNEFVKQGGDAAIYHKVAALDSTKLSDKDALVMKYRFQHGMTRADAEFKVERKYKLNDQLDANDPDVKDARIDLRIDGDEAKKFLSQYKSEQLIAPGEKQFQEERQVVQQRMDSWKPQVQPLVESLKKIEIPYDEKDSITYQVPQETITHVQDYLQRLLQNKDIDLLPTQDGINTMKDLLMREIFYQNRKEINGQIASAVNKKWMKDTNHPSTGKEETPPGAPPAPDNDSSLASFIAKQSGIKNYS